MVINLENKIINDEYTEYVYEAFDIQNREKTSVSIPCNLDLNFDWNIGVILGSSGAGKTSILKTLGKLQEPVFHVNKPLISNFDWLTPAEATFLLTSMGLSSVPTWLRPYRLLSNGEQYRAKLAYLVSKAEDNEIILVDEYTSVVDRDVAKAMSFALQKYVKKLNKKIILASCHFDIMDWLMPDWSYTPLKGDKVQRHEYLRRPSIDLQFSRVEPETWDFFKKYHYLTEEVNKACKFFLFEWNSKPVAILAMINAPRKGMAEALAISRVVVLPDYQGLGIGQKVCEFAAGVFKAQGHRIFIKTVNPALGEYFNRSEKWKGTVNNGKTKNPYTFDNGKYKNRLTRLSYSHEFIGAGIEGFEELIKPIADLRKKK